MQDGEIRCPSSGTPLPNGGFVAPVCHMVGKMRSYILNGYMVVRDDEVMHAFVAETREGAEAYAAAGEKLTWQDFEARGWTIIPVRLEAHRIDA